MLLALVLTVCMFAVPAYADSSSLAAPTIYYKKTSSGAELYLDGINKTFLKSFRKEAGLTTKTTDGFSVEFLSGASDEEHYAISVSASNDLKTDLKLSIKKVVSEEEQKVKKVAVKYYSNK